MPGGAKLCADTCGSLPSSVLDPLKLRGAAVGSLHPYQTVPSREAGLRNLRGCFWGIEGDRQALRVERDWIRCLAGVAFSVRSNDKTLYHLSAFLVCPTVVTLLEQSTLLLKQAGVPPRIARPMLRRFRPSRVEQAGSKFWRTSGTSQALGPGTETVRPVVSFGLGDGVPDPVGEQANIEMNESSRSSRTPARRGDRPRG